MNQRILIYTEISNGKPAAYTNELITYVKETGLDGEISIFGVSDDDCIHEKECAASVSNYVKEKQPSIVIVPATIGAKSVFARVAVILKVGMTADCTSLYVEEGVFKQLKPAFGNEYMVVTEEKSEPAIVTVVVGKEKNPEAYDAGLVDVLSVDITNSKINVIDLEQQMTDSIVEAERVLALGKGVLGNEASGYEKAKELADKLGAAIGGTRPLVDQGIIPFEAQIGQTGCTIHPRWTIFIGVSGAIQHTEGVCASKLTVAVNSDPNAAIFSFADYGIVADCDDFLDCILKQW